LKGPFDPTGRLRMTPGFDIAAAMTSVFFCDTLMEKVAVRPPGFDGRLHRRRAMARSKKPIDV
jgi:hypothetical protein